MRISNYPTDTITGTELILSTDVDTSTQKYKTVNFSVDTLKTFINASTTIGSAPASATAAGTAGDLVFTAPHIYVCVTTGTAGNAAWKRVAISTF